MADISAKDVQALRKATGVGMMDAKRALVQNDGDFEKSVTWLREKGLSKAAERSDRANEQGAVTREQVATDGADLAREGEAHVRRSVARRIEGDRVDPALARDASLEEERRQHQRRQRENRECRGVAATPGGVHHIL